MSDSAQMLDQVEEAQTQKEVTINELVDALSPSSFGGRRASTSMGLTWGYYGGRWDGEIVPHGTIALPASSTCRIVADRATGEIILDTPTDDLWADTTNYAHLYEIETGATAIAEDDIKDCRQGPAGLYGAGGVSITGGSAGVTPEAGDMLYFDGAGWALIPGGDPGQVLVYSGSSDPPAWGDAGAPVEIQLAASDLLSNLVAAAPRAYCRAPCAFTLTEVRASLLTAAASGTVTVDINVNGSTILSTKLTIDATEKTSVTATPAVISSASIADDDEITVDIDNAGTSARGLVVTLIGTR